jgi:hypothetical protein
MGNAQVHEAVGAQVASQLLTIPPPLFRSSQREVAAHLLPAHTSRPLSVATTRTIGCGTDRWGSLLAFVRLWGRWADGDITVAQVNRWGAERIAARFRRVDARRRVGAFLRCLLSAAERKNGWQLAEQAGEASPDGMQRLVVPGPMGRRSGPLQSCCHALITVDPTDRGREG